jgi:serine/threonine-protein kinase HipA
MKKVQKLFIKLDIEGHSLEVGELIRVEKLIYFRYNKEFLTSGLNLSPIKLPFNQEIHTGPAEPFDGLHGVFNDSLPDGWGRLLLDRSLSARGIRISEISPMERLAHVGTGGMGALTYHPGITGDTIPNHSIDLDNIEREMKLILKGSSSEILEELVKLGGSSGGARPKVLVSYHPENDSLIYDEADISQGYEPWMIKFQSSQDHPEISKIEYAYYRIALQAGIEMADSRLFEGRSNNFYFGTKRFDRNASGRLHIHSAAGLMYDNFRTSTMDYGHLMDCAFRLEKHVDAYKKVLRLAAFNVYSHNTDDHSKNFSFLMNAKGAWRFAPAYDLTFSNSGYGVHNTMIAGESMRPGKKHLLALANHFGVKEGNEIIEEVRTAISNWSSIAKNIDLSKASIQSIQSELNRIGE